MQRNKVVGWVLFGGWVVVNRRAICMAGPMMHRCKWVSGLDAIRDVSKPASNKVWLVGFDFFFESIDY